MSESSAYVTLLVPGYGPLPPGMTEADLLRSVLRQVLDKADPSFPNGDSVPE